MDWNNIKRVAKSVGKDILFHLATGRSEVELPPAPVEPEVEQIWRSLQLTKKTRNSVTAAMQRASEIHDINATRSLYDARVDASNQLCTELRLALLAANQTLDDKDCNHSYEIAWVGEKMEHSIMIELRRYTKGYGFFLSKNFISTEI